MASKKATAKKAPVKKAVVKKVVAKKPAVKKQAAVKLKAKPKDQALEVARRLAIGYPEVICELDHRNAFELLSATILSAQCTDVRVNMVTPALFARFPDPWSLASADPSEVETLIRSTGFYQS
ncbi:MAG: endonuclease III, partial [Actinomycetes bacterium]